MALSFKKKKAYGVKPKVRSRAEMDQDYQNHSLNAGHKMRLIRELEDAVVNHVNALVALNAEIREHHEKNPAPAAEVKTEENKGTA